MIIIITTREQGKNKTGQVKNKENTTIRTKTGTKQDRTGTKQEYKGKTRQKQDIIIIKHKQFVTSKFPTHILHFPLKND